MTVKKEGFSVKRALTALLTLMLCACLLLLSPPLPKT